MSNKKARFWSLASWVTNQEMLLKGFFASPLLKHRRGGGEKKTITTQAIANEITHFFSLSRSMTRV